MDVLIIKEIPGLLNVKIISGIDILNNFPKHIHSTYCIGLIKKGKRELIINNESKILSKGDMFIINPNEVHVCNSYKNRAHNYLVLSIESKLIASIVQESSIKSIYTTKFKNFILSNSLLYKAFFNLLTLLEGEEAILEKQTRFFLFLEKIIKDYSTIDINYDTTKNRAGAVKIVYKYIEENYMENISLDSLSKLAKLSPFYLNRLFCNEMGISPHSYQIHVRIEESKKFLSNGLSIANTAFQMGFADQSHYTKFFKKIVGITPGKFVKYNLKVKSSV